MDGVEAEAETEAGVAAQFADVAAMVCDVETAADAAADPTPSLILTFTLCSPILVFILILFLLSSSFRWHRLTDG